MIKYTDRIKRSFNIDRIKNIVENSKSNIVNIPLLYTSNVCLKYSNGWAIGFSEINRLKSEHIKYEIKGISDAVLLFNCFKPKRFSSKKTKYVLHYFPIKCDYTNETQQNAQEINKYFEHNYTGESGIVEFNDFCELEAFLHNLEDIIAKNNINNNHSGIDTYLHFDEIEALENANKMVIFFKLIEIENEIYELQQKRDNIAKQEFHFLNDDIHKKLDNLENERLKLFKTVKFIL